MLVAADVLRVPEGEVVVELLPLEVSRATHLFVVHVP